MSEKSQNTTLSEQSQNATLSESNIKSICVREVSKCLYQDRTVMCMCVREVSKCLYQARIVLYIDTIDTPNTHTHHCPGLVQTHRYLSNTYTSLHWLGRDTSIPLQHTYTTLSLPDSVYVVVCVYLSFD
jgi:hypothetical protein